MLIMRDVLALCGAVASGGNMIWTLGAMPLSLLVIGTPIFALLLAGAMLTFLSF